MVGKSVTLNKSFNVNSSHKACGQVFEHIYCASYLLISRVWQTWMTRFLFTLVQSGIIDSRAERKECEVENVMKLKPLAQNSLTGFWTFGILKNKETWLTRTEAHDYCTLVCSSVALVEFKGLTWREIDPWLENQSDETNWKLIRLSTVSKWVNSQKFIIFSNASKLIAISKLVKELK